ncbi:trypsin-like peptidase domain-containing protein [Nocardia huaxiensis]|uniref:Trypsin-like peptidase domain-containing protein n=1 Tax=Nocardia huaxiensis TaxID=2755382 RepID=A0A7D6VEY5_9NOCA|nr:serine protease [Nocardia huaxiensis]QLY28070.1 trypsin-like peptidase domain-containing protein [Nocardia huaxiensis]
MNIGELDAARRSQAERAGRRYAESEAERRAVEEQRRSTGSAVVDSAEQITARADRLLAQGQVPAEALVELGRQKPLGRIAALERIIGAATQLQAASFLPRGVRAATAVARISLLQNGREIPDGTGSLVSPRLLLTNNHVLPDRDTARAAVIEFGAEMTVENVPGASARFRLDPDTLFLTDAHLDFTLVLVTPNANGATAGSVVGWWNRLIAQQGKIVVGESMNIVGHPMGRLKEISIRENRLDLQLDDFLHYSTDTERGSSGSPVFNDQWEVVALHHSGVPRTDAQGNPVRKDGRPWLPGDSDDTVEWIANEGVRISVILKHLAAQRLDDAQRALLAELGAAAWRTTEAVVPAAPPPAPVAMRAPEAVPRGLIARPAAFGGTNKLLFLHGRGQAGRDPVVLRRTWTAGLNKGLTLAGFGPVDSADVHFPFYGDVLAERSAAPETLGETTALYERIVAEAAQHAGMPDQLSSTPMESEGLREIGSGVIGSLHDQLSWLAARSGLDSLLIARIFKDVADYLDDERTRRAVLDTVLQTVPAAGNLVLVSHSLGTVVAMDLLTRLPGELKVSMLVTAGSPLGLDAVYKKLLVGGPVRPTRVVDWVNTWYAGDPIAIGCPLRRAWGSPLTEFAVENPKDRAHDIAEYLAHPAVAQAIRQQLDRTG